MELLLIRHAPAAPRDTGQDDAERPLTPRGRRRWKRAVTGLSRLGFRFDRLYHSPWRRAVETADVVAPLVDGEVVVTALLTASPEHALLDLLSGERVAVVGHEPWLSELCSVLLGVPQAASRFVLKKGGVAWLEGAPRTGGMSLLALVPPKALRAIRG